jgi:hypothetical protein
LSPVLFVPKQRQPDRRQMCMDFRTWNKVSKRGYDALPHTGDLLNDMSGCKYFTALDLTWGFWALPIVESDQHKAALTGPDGEVYVWTKAPMGLPSSPAAFHRLTAHVLQGIPGMSVYINNITVYTLILERSCCYPTAYFLTPASCRASGEVCKVCLGCSRMPRARLHSQLRRESTTYSQRSERTIDEAYKYS